MLGESVPQTP